MYGSYGGNPYSNNNVDNLFNQFFGGNSGGQQQNYSQQPQGRPQPQSTTSKEKKPNPTQSSKEAEIKLAEQNPNSGHYYKKIGNDFFKEGDYQKAIENYTIAIKMNETESVFFSNRSRCYKLLGNIKQAYEDAVQAVELDERNIKGHLLVGQTLAELGKIEDGIEKFQLAIKRMTRSLSLCSGQGLQIFERDLEKNILRVKKVMWLKQVEMMRAKKLEVYNYLMALVANDSRLGEKEREKKIQDVKQLIGDPTKPPRFEIPQHLCCKITSKLLEDPVVTQAGITYERAALQEHLKKNGLFDPVTRVPISGEYIYPNLNLKQAVDLFLENNPWAFEYVPGETFKDVKF